MEEPKTGTTSRISLNVQAFDTTQIYTSEGFGSVDFLLPEGTYTFVAVGHNVSADKVSDPTIVASIASTTWDTEQQVTY